MISLIAAIGKNLELGYKNELLCHLPKDLKHFKELTSNHTVIMGFNTWESLPKKPLPNRNNIVLTHKNIQIEGATIYHSTDKLLSSIKNDEEVFVMGGASVYQQFLPFADKLYITKIVSDFRADVWFPKINEEDWQISEIEFVKKDEKNIYDLYFQTLLRKK